MYSTLLKCSIDREKKRTIEGETLSSKKAAAFIVGSVLFDHALL